MKVLICGAGQVGTTICEYLSKNDDAEVTIVDDRKELIDQVCQSYDVRAIHGNPCYPIVLEEAEAKDADLLIAVTPSDERNMIICNFADYLYEIPEKIARIRAKGYTGRSIDLSIFKSKVIPVDYIISPEEEVAEDINNRLHTPGSFDAFGVCNKKILVVGIHVVDKAPITGTKLRDFSKKLPEISLSVLSIFRSGVQIYPRGDDEMYEGDYFYCAIPKEQIDHLMHLCGHNERESHQLVIAGGGTIGLNLSKLFLEDDSSNKVSIIELDKNQAIKLAQEIPKANIYHGSAIDTEVLEAANKITGHTFVAVTNDDEINFLSSLLAKRMGFDKAICLINNKNYESLVSSLGVDVIINPRSVTVSKILEHIREGEILSVHSLGDNKGEIIEAKILPNSPFAGKILKNLNLPEEITLGAIVRQGKVIMPRANTMIKADDEVVVFATVEKIDELQKLLKAKRSYF